VVRTVSLKMRKGYVRLHPPGVGWRAMRVFSAFPIRSILEDSACTNSYSLEKSSFMIETVASFTLNFGVGAPREFKDPPRHIDDARTKLNQRYPKIKSG
jgi:hypothetical protein